MADTNDDTPEKKEKQETEAEKQVRIAQLIEKLTQRSKEVIASEGKSCDILGIDESRLNEFKFVETIDGIVYDKLNDIQPDEIRRKLLDAGASEEQASAAYNEARTARGCVTTAGDDVKSILVVDIRRRELEKAQMRRVDPFMSPDYGWGARHKLYLEGLKNSTPPEEQKRTPLDVVKELKELEKKNPIEVINLGNPDPAVTPNSTDKQVLDASKKTMQHVHAKYPEIISDFLKILTTAISTFSHLREVLRGSPSNRKIGSENKKSLVDCFADLVGTFKKSAGISNSSESSKKDPDAVAPKQTPGGPTPQ